MLVVDDDSDYREVSPNEILHRSHRTHFVVASPTIRTLPINKLPWEDFEELSLRLFQQHNEKITQNLQSFQYGGKGSKQHGLDLIAFNSDTHKFIVAECKNVENITPSKLSSWIHRFLNGKRAHNTEKFILITSHSLQSKSRLMDQWLQHVISLHQHGITAELWDFDVLITRLQHSFPTVQRFYGFKIAEWFCLRSSGITKYPIKFDQKKISQSGTMMYFENQSLRLDIFLPTAQSPHLSGCFSFSRADLNGFSLSINSQFLIELMQYRAHSSSIRQSPHLFNTHRDDKYVFALPTARLTLEKNEIDELDWIIEHAWQSYIKASLELEHKWKTIRFTRLSNSKFIFKLCRVEHWFWQEILNYIAQFDYSKGSSEEFIYEATDHIKVYVPDQRSSLEPGYHSIICAYPETSIHSKSLVLGWQPLTDLLGKSADISPRKAWDAEYTHNWLIDIFLPNVYQWVITHYHDKPTNFLDRSLKDIFIPSSSPQSVNCRHLRHPLPRQIKEILVLESSIEVKQSIFFLFSRAIFMSIPHLHLLNRR